MANFTKTRQWRNQGGVIMTDEPTNRKVVAKVENNKAFTVEEVIANARLIASAPDMYKALELLVQAQKSNSVSNVIIAMREAEKAQSTKILEERKQKFGTIHPTMKTICKECGKPYGEHGMNDCASALED